MSERGDLCVINRNELVESICGIGERAMRLAAFHQRQLQQSGTRILLFSSISAAAALISIISCLVTGLWSASTLFFVGVGAAGAVMAAYTSMAIPADEHASMLATASEIASQAASLVKPSSPRREVSCQVIVPRERIPS